MKTSTRIAGLLSIAALLAGFGVGARFAAQPPPPSPAELTVRVKASHIVAGTRANYPGAHAAPEGSVELYLDLMKRALTDLIYEDSPAGLKAAKDGNGVHGRSHTMIGLARLDNLQFCVEDVLKRKIGGDLIECGAWRGGATIFMRSILKAHGVKDRKVWVADSFEGVPAPNPDMYPADQGDELYKVPYLAVSLEEVKDNFIRYGLLDDQVEFLKGWFKDTLPAANIERLAVLRVDGDLYESTMDALKNLYPKLSVGGYVIIDDVGFLAECRKAVEDYRKTNGITAELKTIDWTGVYWLKDKP